MLRTLFKVGSLREYPHFFLFFEITAEKGNNSNIDIAELVRADNDIIYSAARMLDRNKFYRASQPLSQPPLTRTRVTSPTYRNEV